jgi:hypothetical protein
MLAGVTVVAMMVGVQGCAGTTTAGSAASALDPCDQSRVFDGLESVKAFKKACPSYKVHPARPVGRSAARGRRAVGVLGATDAAWNRTHQVDPSTNTPDIAYDPMPRQYGDLQDRYTSVTHVNSRIDSFDLGLPPQTNIRQAIRHAMSTLPKDATHGALVRLDICAAMQVESKTLKLELGSANAAIYFSSGAADDHYSPSALADAEIEANQTIPTQYC